MISKTTGNSASTDDEVVTAYAETWVLSKVFEDMLKRSDDEDGDIDSSAAANEVNKSVALCIAQGITGFGE